MVRVILVGHGEKAKFYREGGKDTRYKKKDDHKTPLTDSAKQECHNLGAFLLGINIVPDVVLTSGFRHSIETGEEIAEEIRQPSPGNPPDCPRLVVVSLTPPPPPPSKRQDEPDGTASVSIAAILAEAKAKAKALEEEAKAKGKVVVINITDTSTLLFVGHHPRLPQLVTMMTGTLTPPLGRLGAVCIEAATLMDLEHGRGEVRWRHPVKPQGEELGDKLTGKMTVAALLAGFNFTALIELIKEPGSLMRENESRWCRLLRPDYLCPSPELDWLGLAAVVALTISLGLFVLAVFVYDRLSMPAKYLENLPSYWLARVDRKRDYRDQRFGYVYTAMIHAWRTLFTPAVIFFLVGLVLVALRIDSILPCIGIVAVLLIALIYIFCVGPRYAVD